MHSYIALLVVVFGLVVAEHPEVLRHLCEDAYGVGWRGTVHSDNKIVCMKAFANVTGGYSGVKKVCEDHLAHVAPVANDAELKLAKELLLELKRNGANFGFIVYLGAKKVGDLSAIGENAKYVWELDNSPIGYEAWAHKEPNDYADSCIGMFPPGSGFGHWIDIDCTFSVTGSICAKHLYPAK